MFRAHWRHVFLMVPLIAVVAGFSYAFAQLSDQVIVTATVPSSPPLEEETTVRFTGLAYPGSDVTIRRNGTILATVPADPQARFDVSVNIDPGIYTFTVFGEDVQGRFGRESNFTLSLTEGTITTISGIFLGPTIEVTASAIQIGDTVTTLGATAPGSDVTLFVSSTLTGAGGVITSADSTFQVQADGDGLWSRAFIASDLGVGTHDMRAKAASPDDQISEFSNTLRVEVAAAPDACTGMSPGDINCDGSVNLIDFSIMLFFWQQTSPSNARADINADSVVNIVDFSIMLFHWTG
ncbi:MAG: hypothetical protein UY34_C0014G0007 [Parcubacteria group bacterium GW2011_GWA2_48_9]|nr:MAG: hypothetical protein UY34_C0014G0007 [Parcubacteria group bacterium GW2011_GWA2_48_9]